ncbi:hypothetical protein MLD63_12860 [Paracoccus sp. TK19116]|uniref:Uncharacterized protein n=1 Tax=Paracoccus albicereus TaxID=2922394 RepID=A0ABT1MUF1_9RHOB|nr:hypothetical protein [Paracoccus albicereus]MCQ0971314.1 hypothetical protein [Paracoccus albicereus]
MRDFFILWMERIINVVIVLGAIAVLIGGGAALFGPQGGILQALAIWIGGALYLIIMGGFVYLGLGIYNNTRRTAEAVERMANRP